MISTRRRTLPLLSGGGLIAAFTILALIPATASATIIIMAPTINLPYSAVARDGSFEIFVQSNETPQPLVGADNVQLQLPNSQTGVTFTLPPNPTPTVHPYLFPGQTPVSAILNGGLTVEGTDFAEGTVPTLSNGVGLLLVDYHIAAGSFGTFNLSFVGYSPPTTPVGTALFDSLNHPLAATLQSGSIVIAAPAPEPAAWLLALMAVSGGGGYLWRVRRAAASRQPVGQA